MASLLTASHGSAELIFPVNLKHLGIHLDLIGGIVFLFAFGAFLLRMPGGAWYRFSRGRILIGGSLALMCFGTMAMALTNWWPLLAAAGFIHGAGYGLASTFMLAVLIDETRGESNAAVTMAWYTGAISAGYAIGLPVAGHIGHALGYPAAFLISGVIGLGGAALALAMTSSAAPQVQDAGGVRAAAPGFWSLLRGVPGLPMTIWLATLLVFYINFLSDTLGVFFPIYALGIGISLVTVGYLKSLNSLSAVAIRFGGVAIFRVVKPGAVNHFAVVLMAVGALAVSAFANVWLLALAFVTMGVCRGLIRVTSATMVADERQILGPKVGVASALYNMGLDAGSMLAPPLTGFLASIYGIPVTFRVVTVSLIVLYYVLWLVHRLVSARLTMLSVGAEEAQP
jgi:MFS family permease